MSEPDPSADPTLELLWGKVVERWDDEAVHRAFLEHCQATDRLIEAAVRYRGLSEDEQRADLAQQQLKRVSVLALAKLERDRSEPVRARPDWPKLLLTTVFLFGSGWLLFYLLQSR